MARLVNVNLERWMTPRDRQIMVSVYLHGILNSKQVEEIHFAGSKNSRIIALRRLKKLVDNGFLKLHWYGYNKLGTMQHFTITNKGAMIVASEYGMNPANIKINDAGIISNIEHTSLIADFHVSLLKNNFKVNNYSVDKHNRVEFNHMGKVHIFEPDAESTVISPTGKIYPFFLEMDRGTMSYNYFKLKIPNYEAYYASGNYKNKFTQFPLVIIITTSETRVKRMREIVDKNKRSDILYLFTTIEKSKFLNKEIFEISGREGKFALK
jgi:Replication-relaxation